MKVGARLKSQVCDGEFVVVKAGDGTDEVTCGGMPLVAERPTEVAPIAAGHDGGSLIGKRYSDDARGLELLCVKSAAGALAVGGELLALREAKKLPSSD